MRRIRIREEEPLVNFKLLYRTSEFSIDVDPKPEGGGGSLQVNYLNLEMDPDGRVLYPWGYCPLFQALPITTVPRLVGRGVLQPAEVLDIVPGIAHSLTPDEYWPVSVNEETGWICIGTPVASESAAWVEFAASSIAVVVDQGLVAIWLQPQYL